MGTALWGTSAWRRSISRRLATPSKLRRALGSSWA